MDTTYRADNGSTITCNAATVDDLKALATLTREPEEALLAAAVESLRAARLRTANARPAAGAKARKGAQ